MQYSRFFVLLGSVFLVLLYVFSHVVFIHSIQGWSGFSVELATNQKAWEFGLMNREYLADNHGMLFIFPSAKKHAIQNNTPSECTLLIGAITV